MSKKKIDEDEEQVFLSVDNVCMVRFLNKANTKKLGKYFKKDKKDNKLNVDYSNGVKVKINTAYLRKFLNLLSEDEEEVIIEIKDDAPLKIRTCRKVCYIAPREDYDIIKTEDKESALNTESKKEGKYR